MAIDGQQLEDAGEAFYRALRLFGGANDYGHSSTRSLIVSTFKTIAVDIASRNGTLSPDQLATIDSMYYLDLGGIDAIATSGATNQARADQAVDQLVELIHQVLANGGDATPVIEAADKLFGAALAIAPGQAGDDRRAAVIARLREATPAKPPALPSSPPIRESGGPDETAVPIDTLVAVPCAARLHDDEICYATSAATLWQEISRVRRRSYAGFSGNVRIARGISFRSGNYAVDQTRTSQLEEIASGELSITNKRLIFLSDARSLDLPLAKLLACGTEPGLIMIARANAGQIEFDQLETAAVEVFEQVSGTSPDHRLAVEQQQEAEYQTLLDDPEEAQSHPWRNMALVVALVIVVLIIIRRLSS